MTYFRAGRDFSRKLPLDKSFRDATADYLKRRWPTNTAKSAAKAFDISLDRARDALAGRASLTTIEAIMKKGGLTVALPLVEEVVGKSFAQHLREMQDAHEENGRRLAALVGDLLPLVADRHPDPASDDTAGPSRSFAPRRRGAGGSDR